MTYRYPLDWIWQGHCLNCGQRLRSRECLCVNGPTKPRPMKELRRERERALKKMSYRLSIELPGLPETTNQILAMPLRKRLRRKRYWKNLVGYLTAGKRPLQALLKARLVLIRHSSGACDYDGLVSSFKHVIDGLVEARVLENDKRENIDVPSYAHAPAPPGKGFCIITVEEIPNETNRLAAQLAMAST